jgi:hypothetical protein
MNETHNTGEQHEPIRDKYENEKSHFNSYLNRLIVNVTNC